MALYKRIFFCFIDIDDAPVDLECKIDVYIGSNDSDDTSYAMLEESKIEKSGKVINLDDKQSEIVLDKFWKDWYARH